MTKTTPEAIAGLDGERLDGMRVLVTGSTDGIGRATALALARLGATVIGHGRDPDKADALVEASGGRIRRDDVHLADFASLEAVDDLAVRVGAGPDLDVLVNNAGGLFRPGRLSADGIEQTFAVNHLAPFVLTARLRPRLDGPDPHVVTVASEAHRGASGLGLDGLRSIEGYRPMRAYARSKLANVMFTYALDRRWDGRVRVNCLHPGFVPGSAFMRELRWPLRLVGSALDALPDAIGGPVRTSVAGAAAAVLGLIADRGADLSGAYVVGTEPRRSSAVSTDRELQRALWVRSLDLAGLDPGDVGTD